MMSNGGSEKRGAIDHGGVQNCREVHRFMRLALFL
jgi:hypothetical protein